MKKLIWAKHTYNDADVIIFGVPDESGSHAARKGASKGPVQLRKVLNKREVFSRDGKTSLYQPLVGHLQCNAYDAGNIKKSKVEEFTHKIIKDGKLPIAIGGDHSISFHVMKSLQQNISLIYFDAHPDFICSTKNYYGSVVCDASNLRTIDFRKSVVLGIRDSEEEEIANIRMRKANVVTTHDFQEKGVAKILQNIKKTVGKNKVYLSVDLDVIDPAFAPGVDTPVPGGLSSREVIYLCKKIAELGLVGFDIMELSPPNDIQDMTSHLAGRLLLEVLASMKRSKHFIAH